MAGLDSKDGKYYDRDTMQQLQLYKYRDVASGRDIKFVIQDKKVNVVEIHGDMLKDKSWESAFGTTIDLALHSPVLTTAKITEIKNKATPISIMAGP
jgi:hypothetical protein